MGVVIDGSTAGTIRISGIRTIIRRTHPEFLLSNFVQGERLQPARHDFS
jgi:hypothetical protein